MSLRHSAMRRSASCKSLCSFGASMKPHRGRSGEGTRLLRSHVELALGDNVSSTKKHWHSGGMEQPVLKALLPERVRGRFLEGRGSLQRRISLANSDNICRPPNGGTGGRQSMWAYQACARVRSIVHRRISHAQRRLAHRGNPIARRPKTDRGHVAARAIIRAAQRRIGLDLFSFTKGSYGSCKRTCALSPEFGCFNPRSSQCSFTTKRVL